jgi:hypothetical protein
MSHVGATTLQARKILSEVGKVTGTRSDSMTQRSQSMPPAQPVPAPDNQAAAVQVAYPSPQPLYVPANPARSPSMVPAYSNSISQRSGSQAIPTAAASGPPQTAQLRTKKSSCCSCANDEIPHLITPDPLPGLPIESTVNPPLPGQVIVGYEGKKEPHCCLLDLCSLSNS